MKIKTSSNLSLNWNVGSNISMLMMIQIATGIILSTSYFFNSNNMFNNSIYIQMNNNYGWINRLIHSNLVSMIFILLMIHMTRSLMFGNLKKKEMWLTGMLMYLIMMFTSFMGYSLIWNQMSFWAMMVITNFAKVLPIIGELSIKWMWGNFFINNIMINRFFTLHFITPMIMVLMMIIHMNILHKTKSLNPIGLNNKMDQINLNPLFIIKDFILITMMLYLLMMIILVKPHELSNPDNFVKMNYLKTPNHIEPEWYFLMIYSILRSVKNKLSGMFMVSMFILYWMAMPVLMKSKFQQNKIMKTNKHLIMMVYLSTANLTMMGKKIMEFPFSIINSTSIIMFFMAINMSTILSKTTNK